MAKGGQQGGGSQGGTQEPGKGEQGGELLGPDYYENLKKNLAAERERTGEGKPPNG